MKKLGFFNAVTFNDQHKSGDSHLVEIVDSYFYLGGKKAYVVAGHTQQGREGVIMTKDSPPFLITVLKVISYLTLSLPVVLLIAKVLLRSIHTFHIVDVQQKLEEGINIPQAAIQKIQELMIKIQARQDDSEIKWHGRSNNLVFSLTSAPHLFFKMAHPEVSLKRESCWLSAQQILVERFANMVKAKEVCLAHQLNLIIVPHAKKFNAAGMTLIAEERLNINLNESAQEHFYQLPGLNETVKQLATFITKTGFSDVEWRNMPIVDTAPDFPGNRHVALIDLEEMSGAEIGIFGNRGLYRRGLIQCLYSEEQIDIAIAEAHHHGVSRRDIEQIKARRMEEIQSDSQLQQFYMKNGIVENERKTIQVEDLESLGLDLEEQGLIRKGKRLKNSTDSDDWEWETTPVTMRQAITDVIAAINKRILETPENASLKGKRYVLLDPNTNEKEKFFLKEYDRLGCKEFGSVSAEELNQRWLKRIIDALVAKGYIFKLDKQNAYGYFVQA